MSKQHHSIPGWVWQMLLMGLLGLSGLIFVPMLLRCADPQLMANVLVAQVNVYYLVVLVQYGFAFSGPAAVARAANATDIAQLWRSSVRGKLLLLALPVASLFGVGYACIAEGQWYLWLFAALLGAYALNSNWWLQTQLRFAPAVGFAALGVMASALLVQALVGGYLGSAVTTQGAWLVLVLILPQVFIGVGTWWVARFYANHETKPSTITEVNLDWIRTDAPLVASQLLLLASTTLGTVVVGWLADASTTAAYAAIEKLFNLAATVLVGFYMAIYPKLAILFYKSRNLYWRATQLLLLICVCGGMLLAAILAVVGPLLLGWYLPAEMLMLVVPVLWQLSLWLGLCISQHVLTSHLVLAERKHMVLWANGCVLLTTVAVGFACAFRTPVDWVYGMVAGQVLALVWLLQMYLQEKGWRNR